MVGHIKLDRKILEWEWYKDANVYRVFTHLLIIANYKDGRWQGNNISRGQTITGRIELATVLGLSEMQIRVALNKLKSTKEISIHTTNKFSLITICKYDDYQSKKDTDNQQDNQQGNQPVTNKQPTDNQQVTTNNKYNNSNKENKEINTEDFLWENEKGYFFNSGKWIFKFCTDKNISVELFDEKAKEFISDIELKADYKPVKELQRHFTNWYNLKNKNGKTNGFHKQNRELTQHEKEIADKRERAKNKVSQ